MKALPEHARFLGVSISLLSVHASTLTDWTSPGPDLPGRPSPRTNRALRGVLPVQPPPPFQKEA